MLSATIRDATLLGRPFVLVSIERGDEIVAEFIVDMCLVDGASRASYERHKAESKREYERDFS